MTKSQEQRMNELAEDHYKKTGHVATEWAVMNYQAGYQAAMKEAEVLVEAVEVYCELNYLTKLEEALKKFKGE